MAEVAKAWVTIIPTVKGAQGEVTKAIVPATSKAGTTAGKSLGTSLISSLKSYSKQIVGALGLASVTKLAKDSVGAFTDLAGQTKSLQRVMGGTATEVSSLAGAMKLSGVDTSKASTSLSKFAKNMSSAAAGSSTQAKAFESLGVAVKNSDGSMRSTSDVLTDVAAKFKEMPDGAEKTAAAMTLFGKSGTAMLPFLNKGADGIEELKNKAKELGIVIDDDGISKWAAYKGAIREWDTALQGAQVTLGGALVPFITAGATALTTVLVPAISGAANMLASFFDGITSGIDIEGIKSAFGGIGDAFGAAFGQGQGDAAASFGAAVAGALNGLVPTLTAVQPLFGALGEAVGFVGQHPEVVTIVSGIAVGIAAMNAASAVAGGLSGIVAGISGIVERAVGAVTGLLGIAGAETAAGAAGSVSAGQILAAAAAVVALGAGVFLAASGLSMIASAAISVSGAGAGAAVAMGAMVAVIAGLAVGAAALGPALTAGSVGMLAFGAAVALVGAGIGVASAGMALLASQVPTLASSGGAAASALAAIAASTAVIGPAATIAAAGLVAIAAPAAAAAAAIGAMAWSMGDTPSKLNEVGSNSRTASSGLRQLATAPNAVSASFRTMQSTVTSSMTSIQSKITSAMSAAQRAFSTPLRVNVQKHIALPHFSMSGEFNAQTKAVPHVNVSWYKMGGVFSSPSIVGVGDASSPEVIAPQTMLENVFNGVLDERSNGGTYISIDGVTVNDYPEMVSATRDYLTELHRIGQI